MKKSKKFGGVERTGRVAFVADVPTPRRGVEVRGRAEAVEGSIRTVSGRIVGWGIDPAAPSPNVRTFSGSVTG